MKATHRVKDSSGNTAGFIIGGTFYLLYDVKSNIEIIDNLVLTSNDVVKAKRELPIINYKDVVSKYLYKRAYDKAPYFRDIQEELMVWKKNSMRRVLQLDGPRQSGKTSELLKFAYKNYDYTIYINLVEDLEDFLVVLKNGATGLELEKYCRHKKLPSYVNNRNTILIIDEIQRSSTVYNYIRRLNDNLDCDIIVTGSYLGQTLKPEFFLPAGTITHSYMFPLSFKEFVRIFNCEETLQKISLYGKSANEDYEKLFELYDVYLKIGGYPEVVKTYANTKDISQCYNVISDLLTSFKKESRNYFNTAKEVELFNAVYRDVLKLMRNRDYNKEKGKIDSGKNIVEELTKLTKESTKTLITRDEINNAINWILCCGLWGKCHLANNGDLDDILFDRKIYYTDCGIASYLGKITQMPESDINGIVVETFVYAELHRLFKVPYNVRKVKEEEVLFATFGNNELDFIVVGKDDLIYGIEVKKNTGDPKSLKVFISKGLVDRGIVAKRTKGGHGDKFDAIPIYAVGCRFPYK